MLKVAAVIKGVMTFTVSEQIKLRDSFLELTSDRALRMAAYPQEEWVENGGGIYSGFLGGSLNSYASVVTQDLPPVINPQYGLLDSCKPEPIYQDLNKRAKNIAIHWQKVQSHDYYKWLMSDDNFKKAWPKFQKKKDKIACNNLVWIVKKLKPINSEFADFHFLRLVALHIGFQIIADSAGYKPSYADSKTLGKARGYITNLQAAFKGGVSLGELLHQQQLESHLEQLLLEIERAPRKEKVTNNFEKRKCLESFALSFMLNFWFVSATILIDLSAMLGWSCEHTTIERIVKATKSKKAQQLAKALKNHTAQNSQK